MAKFLPKLLWARIPQPPRYRWLWRRSIFYRFFGNVHYLGLTVDILLHSWFVHDGSLSLFLSCGSGCSTSWGLLAVVGREGNYLTFVETSSIHHSWCQFLCQWNLNPSKGDPKGWDSDVPVILSCPDVSPLRMHTYNVSLTNVFKGHCYWKSYVHQENDASLKALKCPYLLV